MTPLLLSVLLAGPPQDDPDVLLLLHARDAADRAAAARVLGARRSIAAAPPLIEALKDEEPVRGAAHQALVKITGVDTLPANYEEWHGWWTSEGIKLISGMPGGQAAVTAALDKELEKVRKEIGRIRDQDIAKIQEYNKFLMGGVVILWLVFLLALLYFAGHLSSKLKEWKDVMKQADQYLRESEEVTKRTDRIIDELDSKKTEMMDFFKKLKEDNEGELERFADLLEQNTDHRMRLEVMGLRQKAEKEMEQTVNELRTVVDHELRRAANEHRGRAEKELEARQKEFMAQIETHSLFVEAAFFRAQGRHEEALRVYKRLLERRPDHSLAWTNMGDVLRDLLRYDEALEAHGRALELAPADSAIHYHRALTYACMKRREAMLADLGKAFANNGQELKDEALNEPIFKPYWNDPAFKDLAEG
jgi:tetratricopeptide (TPR) repeat protein